MLRNPISVHQTFNQERKPDTRSIKDATCHWNQGVVILKVSFDIFFAVARVPLNVSSDKEHENQC